MRWTTETMTATPYQRGINARRAGRFNPIGFLTPRVPVDLVPGSQDWHQFIEGWCSTATKREIPTP